MRSDSVFFSELEGIRGYAFILVFFVHYTYPLTTAAHTWTYPLRLLADMSWIAVPIFFVLSGFLITGILRRTLAREGYFRVFYIRRALRVFPLYFIVVGTLGITGFFTAQDVRHLWPTLVYLQNVLPDAQGHLRGITVRGVPIEMSHLWSMALEEQFYLIWPWVIWRFRSRRSLFQVFGSLVCVFTVMRLLCPVFGLSAQQAYFSSLTRADAVVLGALLAICREAALWPRLQRLARPVSLAGLLVLALVAVFTGTSNPFLAPGSLWRVYWMVPLVNLTAAALVLETLRDGGRLQQLCRWSPIRRLGAMSYAAYVFHLLPCAFFCTFVLPWLQARYAHRFALVLTLGGAFALTLLAAWLSYRILEAPAMRLKERFVYGALVSPAPQVVLAVPRPPQGRQPATGSALAVAWRPKPQGRLTAPSSQLTLGH